MTKRRNGPSEQRRLYAIQKLERQFEAAQVRADAITRNIRHMVERQEVQQDFWTFITKAMGFEDLYEPLHRPLCDLIDNRDLARILVLLPRGHFKTTIISICYPLFLLVNNPNERVSLCSSTSQKAEENLEEVIDRANRDLFQFFCGDRLGPPGSWVKCSRIQIRVPRDGSTTGPSVAAFGVESAEVGRHFSTMILDDIVGQAEVNSVQARDNVWLWFGRSLSVLDPGSRMIILGTRWHFDDVYSRIMANLDCYSANEKAQIMDGQKLEQKWWVERREVVENNKLIFPTRFSLRELAEIKKVQGDYTYSCFYHNDPVGEGNNPFDIRRFVWVEGDEPEYPGETPFYHVLVDPAQSGEAWACNSGLVVYEAHHDRTCTLVEAIREKLHPDDLIDKIFELVERYNIIRAGIEDEAYQKSLVLWLRREMPARKLSFQCIPVKIPRNIKRYTRFEALQPFLHNGIIKLRRNMRGRDDVLEEFEQYPKGSKDDLIAALAMLPNCTVYPPKRKRKPKEPVSTPMDNFLQALIKKNQNGNRGRYLPRIRVR